nr:MAG: replication associated protein [Cressdnaviricota sp.]
MAQKLKKQTYYSTHEDFDTNWEVNLEDIKTQVKKSFNAKKRRAYTFTINNYTEGDLYDVELLKSSDRVRYIIAGYEVGENNTPHIQGYVYFENAITMKSMSVYLPRAHLEGAKGTSLRNQEYCSKEGKVFCEKGEPPMQGKRNDLDAIKKEIALGKQVDDICMENPMIYHQYGRTLSKIEDICFRKKYRSEMTKGIWIYGGTGVGKSHMAFENYTPDTHYVLNINDNGWWEGYTGQENVIINEFRGQIKFSELLDLVDKWPKTVKRRNREPAPFISKTVWVTSCFPPEEVYCNMEGDCISQLYRRFKVYYCTRCPPSVAQMCSGGNSVTPEPPTICEEKFFDEIYFPNKKNNIFTNEEI